LRLPQLLLPLQGQVLLARHAGGVVAAIDDLLLDRLDLSLRLEDLVVLLEGRLPLSVALDDGDDGLAGDVAAQDEDVRLVERPGVQELPPADLGAVDASGVENLGHPPPSAAGHSFEHPRFPRNPGPAAQCAISSGSSYHCTRSPTLERSFHFRVFGAVSACPRRIVA